MDPGFVSVGGDFIPADLADRGVGVIVYLAVRDLRNRFVQQCDQTADHPGLGLASLSKKNHVLACQDGVLQLRNDCMLKANYAGENDLFRFDLGYKILAHLFAYRYHLITAGTQFSDGSWQGR